MARQRTDTVQRIDVLFDGQDHWLTLNGAALATGMSYWAVRRLVDKHGIEKRHLGSTVLVPYGALLLMDTRPLLDTPQPGLEQLREWRPRGWENKGHYDGAPVAVNW